MILKTVSMIAILATAPAGGDDGLSQYASSQLRSGGDLHHKD
jgi:hypothetical protein